MSMAALRKSQASRAVTLRHNQDLALSAPSVRLHVVCRSRPALGLIHKLRVHHQQTYHLKTSSHTPAIDMKRSTVKETPAAMASSDGISMDGAEIEALRLRSYQQEMLELSLSMNTMVVMDTGSGKTHVAIARIRAQLEISDSKQLIWFICPSVALSHQQRNVLARHLSAYLVKTLVGSDGVDKWTDQKLWDAALYNVRVVVGTPAVLLDALTHGFVHMSRLSLLVFDEAHRCVKDSPMNQIMRNFYHPRKSSGQKVPDILGLTASPVTSANVRSLRIIEANLDCVAVTPKQHRSELLRFVHPPEIVSVLFIPPDGRYISILLSRLHSAIQRYDITFGSYAIYAEFAAEDELSANRLSALNSSLKMPYELTQLKILQRRSEAVWEQLGPSAADWYLSQCIDQFCKDKSDVLSQLHDTEEKGKLHLRSILRNINSIDRASAVEQNEITDKVKKLVSSLLENATSSTRAIIFVEQRAVVVALAWVLRSIPAVGAKYSIGISVGMSSFTGRTGAIADLVDLKEQQNDLVDFREGRKNIIISTTVLEEGIDVNACNLVVCFDPPKNLISFVQRRGRARQRASKYVLFVNEKEGQDEKHKWQLMESQMIETYMSEHRDEIQASPEDEIAFASKKYRISSTEALLTLENTKAHLYHFCAVGSTHTSFVDLRPEFNVETSTSKEGTTLYTASVTLPTFVHRDLRCATSAQAWHSEDAAVRDASFESYVKLHRAGLINDNLLPLTKDYGPDEEHVHVYQPSIVQVANRKSSWKSLAEAIVDEAGEWFPHRVEIDMGSSGQSILTMWLPSPLAETLKFPLYWNETIVFSVQVCSTGALRVRRDDPVVARLQEYTERLLSGVHGSRMSSSKRDFLELFSPENIIGPISHAWRSEAPYSAVSLFDEERPVRDVGIVRNAAEHHSPYMLVGLSESDDMEHGSRVKELRVRKFPKRRDFLHPIPPNALRNAAYTTVRTLLAEDCTIDQLPLSLAISSALLPSILHQVDISVHLRNMQVSVLKDLALQDVGQVREAISAPAAREASDYNRLEYLGDCILKFVTVLQVSAQHLVWPEGYLCLEKFRIVSNNSLAKAALAFGLDQYVLDTSFTGSKWRPHYVSELLTNTEQTERSMSRKVLADVVEALIGASYLAGGLQKATGCIRSFLANETWYTNEDCVARLVSEVPTMDVADMHLLEQLIGYKFRHPALLVTAITHASLPHNPEGVSYERLEFLGDAVLDMVLVPLIFAHERHLRHYQLHTVHKALVNAEYLGFCCMNHQIEEDAYAILEERTGGWPAQMHAQKQIRTVGLHNFIRAGEQMILAKERSLSDFRDYRDQILQALEAGTEYPWTEFAAMAPNKFFSDIVESILGALLLDSQGDLIVCRDFVDNLGIIKHLDRFLNAEIELLAPKERVGILAGKRKVKYQTSRSAAREGEGEATFDCAVYVGDAIASSVVGCRNKDEAEARAASQAIALLKSNQVQALQNDALRTDAQH